MATTLVTFRTTRLNPDLGLASDSDNQPFGDTVTRNNAVKVALGKLWPTMARLAYENVTIVANQLDYTLTTLRDVVAIELIRVSTGYVDRDKVDWRFTYDETTPATPIRRLRVAGALSTAAYATMRVIGYIPYKSELTGDSDTLDLPVEFEWVAETGARAECLRRKANERANFQQFQNLDRATDVTLNELLTLYQVANAEFQSAIAQHRRDFVTGKPDRFKAL